MLHLYFVLADECVVQFLNCQLRAFWSKVTYERKLSVFAAVEDDVVV